MKNESLKEVYNKAELEFYPGFMESLLLLQLIAPDTWEKKTVLEIGCGEGHLASMIHYAGATSVYGTDYAEEQIEKAKKAYNKKDLSFGVCEATGFKGEFDVVVMQGVLEHMDDPLRVLKTIMEKNLTTTGSIIFSVPNWSNPRGYIYHTCRILYGAFMSLTDLNFFTPQVFIDFAKKNNCQIIAQTTDVSLGLGEDMVSDLTRRIPLADPNIKPEKVKELMDFAKNLIPHTKEGELSGATIGYRIDKMPVQSG